MHLFQKFCNLILIERKISRTLFWRETFFELVFIKWNAKSEMWFQVQFFSLKSKKQPFVFSKVEFYQMHQVVFFCLFCEKHSKWLSLQVKRFSEWYPKKISCNFFANRFFIEIIFLFISSILSLISPVWNFRKKLYQFAKLVLINVSWFRYI